jgi:hypothetical protein
MYYLGGGDSDGDALCCVDLPAKKETGPTFLFYAWLANIDMRVFF